MPGTEPVPTKSRKNEEQPVLGWMASDVDALKHRSFAACTPDELAALRRIMTRMRLTPPRRRTRRTRPATGRGTEPDLRKTIRESMRMHGEPPGAVLPAAQDQAAAADPHPRRLRLDGRLLAAPAAVRARGQARGRAGRGVLLRHQADPHHQGAGAPADRRSAWSRRRGPWSTGMAAPGSASHSTPSCGRWGRGSLCRGGVVVICSDGLDRGDPEVLARRWSGSTGSATGLCG